MMDYKNRNVLALAYVGDAIYEIYIRKFLIDKGIEKVNDLQKQATEYVSARGQSKYLKKMLDGNYLLDDEIQVVMRARNHKTNSHPKNTDIVTYKHATGLEALIGWLYLSENISRVEEIMNYILEV
jgi:Uncharacterized protein conserved in bacteria